MNSYPPPSLSIATLAFALFLGAPALQPAAHAQTADPPSPDVVVFSNGDQLTGTLERGIGDSIVFKSDMAGEVTIPLAKVKELRSTSNFAVLRKDQPVTRHSAAPIVPGSISIEGDTVKVSSSNATETDIPIKDIGFIIDEKTYLKETSSHKSFLYGWNGTISGGATIVRSTQNGSTYNAGLALTRTIPTVPYLPKRNRTIGNLTETYGKLTQPAIPETGTLASTVITSIFHADAEQDEYVSNHFYLLGTTSFDHNYSQGLSLQQLYGAGVGWTPFETPKQELDLRADLQYEKQHFIQPTLQVPPLAGSPDQNLIGSTISEKYLRHLPGKLVLTESGNVLPAFNNIDAYSANATFNLALPVFHRLAVNFNATDNYLNDPAAGFKKNSYQFVTAVSYTLH